jgi:hypothetical protein
VPPGGTPSPVSGVKESAELLRAVPNGPIGPLAAKIFERWGEADPGHPAGVSLRIHAGDRVSKPGTRLVTGPSVEVLKDGAPLDGVDVSFRITKGNGALDRSRVTTDPNGIAAVGWTLGDKGENELVASVGGSDVTFKAIAK